MSKYHAVSSGMVTRSALPSITRQRGTTTGSANLMLYGAGKTTATNNITFVDSSANAFTVTRNGDTVQSGFNPFSQASAGAGYFDGTGDYLSCASNAAFAFGTGNFTVEAWVYVSTVAPASQAIIDTRSSQPSSTGFYFGLASATIQIFSSGVINLTGGTIVPSAWTHVALTRSGTTIRLFVNGTQVNSTTNSTNWTDNNMLVGVSAGLLTPITGYMSNLRLVKGTAVYTSNFTPPTSPLTAITNTSLLLLMDNYSIVNSTATNLPVTINGNTTISTAQYPTGMSSSIYFDGTGDYLTLPSNAALGMGSGDFTVEFWLYQTVLSNLRQILDVLDGNSAGRLILWVNSAGAIINLGASGITRHSSASGAVVANTWTHIALVRSSGVTKFYSNGVQSGSSYTDSTNYTCTTGSVFIGVNSDGSTYAYQGYISNFRMVKGTALYTANFTVPTPPLSTTVTVPAYVTNNIYGMNQIP